MSVQFPEPTSPISSRSAVFLGYLDFFRARVVEKVSALPETELLRTRLPSGWTPAELLKHLTYVELRWLEWGFEGWQVSDPWGDQQRGRWHVGADESLDDLLEALRAQAARTRTIVEGNDLAAVGKPGPRWEGAAPATLERILFHLLQEYARHLGQLDVVSELAGGPIGE